METPISPNDSPPPLTPPPPVIAPPYKPRRSRGWMIFAIILIILLCVSLFVNFAQFAHRIARFGRNFDGFGNNAIAHSTNPKLDEFVLDDNNSRNKIAVVTVDGIITDRADSSGNSMVDLIKAQLDRAEDDDRVKAVILKVDSPGGEVMASDQINKLISKFENSPDGKPVICSMGSLAASGGYYISAPCRWIVANDLTLTGSIGVIMHGYNFRGLMDKIGVLPETYKSGKFKDMLSGERETNEIPPEEHAMVQKLIDETYQKFKGVVASGREIAHEKNKNEGRALAADWTNYADGRVVSGEEALRLGFVDELGDFDAAVDRAEKIAHIHSANVVEYRERYDISNFLQMFGQSAASHNLKLDLGVNVPKLQAGYLYFLAPMFVN